jgi:hypothetical protein
MYTNCVEVTFNVPFVTLPCLKIPDVFVISYSDAQYSEEVSRVMQGNIYRNVQ